MVDFEFTNLSLENRREEEAERKEKKLWFHELFWWFWWKNFNLTNFLVKSNIKNCASEWIPNNLKECEILCFHEFLSYGEHSVVISEVYCHTFLTNFVKVTFILKKILKSWFDEKCLGDSKFFIFPHCGERKCILNSTT